MIELAQHIEALLLENDCVIIPGLGGFVAHYTPAQRIENEALHLPPTRTIGFNPQLKLNDGLLVQSYMSVYDTSFSDATKIVEGDVSKLIAILHNDGKAELPNVGEICYTIYNNYEFAPYDHKITTPYLYGMDSFEIKEIAALRKEKKSIPMISATQKEKTPYEIRVGRSFLRNAVAAVAAIALFLGLSTPIENTAVRKDNYAQLLPMELFEKIEKQSLVMAPITSKQANKPKATKAIAEQRKNEIKPIAVKEIKVAAQPISETTVKVVEQKQTEGNYYIIVAGGIKLKDAQAMAEELKIQGFRNATVLNRDEKIRVSILSCTTHEEATKQLLKLRENDAYKNAWMLSK